MLIALGVIAVGVIVWLAVGTFNGSDIDSSSSGVDTAQVKEIDSVTDTETSDVVPIEVENETEVAAELEGRYQRDYSAAAQASSSSRLPDKAVDLGLSVYWSDRNVGASSPSDYGGYYAWGETSTKSDYSWSTYTHCDGSYNTCHNIGSNIAGSRYDVARQAWGGGWKIPTKAQWEELENRCTWTWTTEGGHSGYKVTGPNGNSIFLPAAGARYGTSSEDVGRYGFYWSSTLFKSGNNAYHQGFDRDCRSVWSGYGSSGGFTVRPVTEKQIFPY